MYIYIFMHFHYPTSAEECQTGLQSACSTPACSDQKEAQSSVRSAKRFFRQPPAATWSSGSMRCCSKSTQTIWQGSVSIHVMRHLFVFVFFLRFENGKFQTDTSWKCQAWIAQVASWADWRTGHDGIGHAQQWASVESWRRSLLQMCILDVPSLPEQFGRQSHCQRWSEIPPEAQVAPTGPSGVQFFAKESKVLCKLQWWGCSGTVKKTGCHCTPCAYQPSNLAKVYHTGMPAVFRWHGVKKELSFSAGPDLSWSNMFPACAGSKQFLFMFFEGKFGNKEVALLNWLKLCGCASFQEFSDKKRFAHLECLKQWPRPVSLIKKVWLSWLFAC